VMLTQSKKTNSSHTSPLLQIIFNGLFLTMLTLEDNSSCCRVLYKSKIGHIWTSDVQWYARIASSLLPVLSRQFCLAIFVLPSLSHQLCLASSISPAVLLAQSHQLCLTSSVSPAQSRQLGLTSSVSPAQSRQLSLASSVWPVLSRQLSCQLYLIV